MRSSELFDRKLYCVLWTMEETEFGSRACSSRQGLCWLQQLAQLWIIQPQTLIKHQTASPAASGNSWISLALHTLLPSLTTLTGARPWGSYGWPARGKGASWHRHRQTPAELTVPGINAVAAFTHQCLCKAEGRCLQQKLWLMLGPPVIPKGRRFFFFLNPLLQWQT